MIDTISYSSASDRPIDIDHIRHGLIVESNHHEENHCIIFQKKEREEPSVVVVMEWIKEVKMVIHESDVPFQ